MVVRPLDNPLLEAELERRRTRFGNRVIAKKEAAREVLRAMRANQTVAILIDQNVLEREAIFVPFFGRLAATTPSLGLLQLKTGAAVLPVFTWPIGGGRYETRLEPPIWPEEFESRGDRPRRQGQEGDRPLHGGRRGRNPEEAVGLALDAQPLAHTAARGMTETRRADDGAVDARGGAQLAGRRRHGAALRPRSPARRGPEIP